MERIPRLMQMTEYGAKFIVEVPTLRDQFAMAALQGLISGAVGDQALGHDHPENNIGFARVSYLLADAMLRARQPHPQEGGEDE